MVVTDQEIIDFIKQENEWGEVIWIGKYGSNVRGYATANSDIDIIYVHNHRGQYQCFLTGEINGTKIDARGVNPELVRRTKFFDERMVFAYLSGSIYSNGYTLNYDLTEVREALIHGLRRQINRSINSPKGEKRNDFIIHGIAFIRMIKHINNNRTEPPTDYDTLFSGIQNTEINNFLTNDFTAQNFKQAPTVDITNILTYFYTNYDDTNIRFHLKDVKTNI